MANEVKINVSADTAGATKKLSSMSDQMKAVGRTATIAGGAILAMGAGSLMQFSKLGDQVHKLSMRTGFSTETLSELRLAAELSGTSLESLEKGIGRMQRTLLDASEGMVSAEDALTRMGLSADTLKGLNPEEQFEIMTNALANIEDPSVRAATAMEVFGRAGTQLLPMMASGQEGLDAMKEKAHELGLVFDQEAANKAAKLTDGLTTLKGSMTGVMMTIAESLAPVVTSLAAKIETGVQSITKWTEANPGLTRVIVLAVAAVGGLLAVLGPLLMLLPGIVAIAPAVGLAFHAMLGPLGLITGAITLVIVAVVALKKAWEENLFGIQDITKQIWEKVAGLIGTAIDWIVEKLNKMIDGVNAVGGIFGKQIPHIEEIGASILDLGKSVQNTAKDFLGLGKASRDATNQIIEDRSRLNVSSIMALSSASQGGAGTGFGGGGSIGGGGGMGGSGRFAPAMTAEQIAAANIFRKQLQFLTNPEAQIGNLTHEQITGGLRKIGLSDRMPASFTVDHFGQASIEYPAIEWQQIEESNTT
jgi:uncharacterized protein YoxC